MFKATILLILGMFLVILCAIFIYKNFLSQYNMSESGFLNALVIFLVIMALFGSFAAIVGALGLQETISYLNSSPNIAKDQLDMLEKSVLFGNRQLIEYLLIGYLPLVVDFIIIKRIQKKKQIKVDNYTNKRWHLK